MIREEVSARLLQTDVTRSYIKMWNPKYICNSDIVNLKQPQNFRIKLKWARAKSVKSSFYNSVAFFRIQNSDKFSILTKFKQKMASNFRKISVKTSEEGNFFLEKYAELQVVKNYNFFFNLWVGIQAQNILRGDTAFRKCLLFTIDSPPLGDLNPQLRKSREILDETETFMSLLCVRIETNRTLAIGNV